MDALRSAGSFDVPQSSRDSSCGVSWLMQQTCLQLFLTLLALATATRNSMLP